MDSTTSTDHSPLNVPPSAMEGQSAEKVQKCLSEQPSTLANVQGGQSHQSSHDDGRGVASSPLSSVPPDLDTPADFPHFDLDAARAHDNETKPAASPDLGRIIAPQYLKTTSRPRRSTATYKYNNQEQDVQQQSSETEVLPHTLGSPGPDNSRFSKRRLSIPATKPVKKARKNGATPDEEGHNPAQALPTEGASDRQLRGRPSKSTSAPWIEPPDSTSGSQEQIFPDDASFAPATASTKLPLTHSPDKPLPKGRPPIWAADRQSLCETLSYYRSYQGSCYMHGGQVYAMMFDENSHERDYMDSHTIVSRAGGGMTRDSAGGMVQIRPQSENAQTRSMQKNLSEQIPIVIICGNKNTHSQAKMPYRYNVLGFFKVTDIIYVKGKRASQNVVQYRFEKLNPDEEAWWEPADSEPTLQLGELGAPLQKRCGRCGVTQEQVYQQWACLSTTCTAYWKLSNGSDLQPSDIAYFNPQWLKKQTRWSNEEDPFDVVPLRADSKQALDITHPHDATRGICCPKCGMCNSRYQYKGWKCDNITCDFVHIPTLRPAPIQATRNLARPIGMGRPISYDIAEPHIKRQHEFRFNHQINMFQVPGFDDDVVIHMIANQRVLEESGGPDDMWKAMQEVDIGLERRHLVTGKAFGRMQAFSVNHGYPYKFVGKVPSQTFDNAPQVITDTRTQLNFWSKLVLGNAFPERAYNELLTFAYLEGQKIKYHDDGESGLGPTVSSFSLGAPAEMRFRLKGKYYSGVQLKTRDGKDIHDDHDDDNAEDEGVGKRAKAPKTTKHKLAYFVDEVPIPNTLNYEARKKAYESLGGLSREERQARCWALPSELGLKYKKSPPALISCHLAHGDKIIMHGEALQKYFEHEVEPATGYGVRFVHTCRVILPEHLPKDQRPDGPVTPDTGIYNGSDLE
ncbi:2OG-Fe(II) oxygenase superfamily-domain-containing protein [Delphinella strobiligena]|nr:2OG-Fe(II) oxygenase superfamily-domain-containing protein [Delphinella strobiligena]